MCGVVKNETRKSPISSRAKIVWFYRFLFRLRLRLHLNQSHHNHTMPPPPGPYSGTSTLALVLSIYLLVQISLILTWLEFFFTIINFVSIRLNVYLSFDLFGCMNCWRRLLIWVFVIVGGSCVGFLCWTCLWQHEAQIP